MRAPTSFITLFFIRNVSLQDCLDQVRKGNLTCCLCFDSVQGFGLLLSFSHQVWKNVAAIKIGTAVTRCPVQLDFSRNPPVPVFLRNPKLG